MEQPREQSSTRRSTSRNKNNGEGPIWKSAVDPESGQTYWYDAITRKTQWEKPAEIRALEKQARREKRRQDKLFFREMERNIYNSFAKGKVFHGQPELSSPKSPQSVVVEDATTSQRVRTISGMDKMLLAQLQKQERQLERPKLTSTKSTEGRPPRPLARRDAEEAKWSRRESSESTLAGEFLLDGPITEDVKMDGVTKPQHVRRNTGGTIFVQSTMASPNVEATIKCVCGVFRAHILQATARSKTGSPPSVAYSHKVDVMQVFDDDQARRKARGLQGIPSLQDICAFYQDFYERSQMEHDTIIMSLIYVERLIKEASIHPTPQNWKSVLFSSMVLASKVWDDLSMWNIDFSHVCGKKGACFSSFTLARINELELALLKSLNFNVKVPASEYAKYYFLIRSMLIKSGCLNEVQKVEKKPLDMQGAKNLETLSSNYQETFVTREHSRRSKSMDGYFWFFPHKESRQPESSVSCSSNAGPVLTQSVCLEQLVSM